LGVDTIKLSNGGNSVEVKSTGTVVTGPLIINGIVFNSHVHGGVQSGGSTTGIPT
jgi:phage baseplate assembly protein gpV